MTARPSFGALSMVLSVVLLVGVLKYWKGGSGSSSGLDQPMSTSIFTSLSRLSACGNQVCFGCDVQKGVSLQVKVVAVLWKMHGDEAAVGRCRGGYSILKLCSIEQDSNLTLSDPEWIDGVSSSRTGILHITFWYRFSV